MQLFRSTIPTKSNYDNAQFAGQDLLSNTTGNLKSLIVQFAAADGYDDFCKTVTAYLDTSLQENKTMAFENAFLTEEEKTEFKTTKAIPHPWDSSQPLYLSRWTIDREQNVFLVKVGQNRDEPSEYYFILYWKGTPINVNSKEHWTSGSPRTWDLLRLSVPLHLEQQRDEIIGCLKDALTVWAFDGDPNEPFNQTTKVQFTF